MPDNTVLVNFAQIGRMDLLRLVAENRSIWCYTVADECGKSARIEGLEQLAEAPGIFGDPLKLETPVEHSDVQVFRARLRKPGDGPAANLGEAESLSIIMNRKLNVVFITDDNGALGFAAEHKIPYTTTWDLLKMFVRAKKLDRSTAWHYVRALGGHKRRYEELRNLDAFYDWLETKDPLRFIP
jgi:predicted nucleic acid-binding protein